MIVYRFSHSKFKDDYSGTGAKMFGGRWNERGFAALYSSSSISLSLLEVLVNASTIEELKSLALIKIEVPKSLENSIQPLSKLKSNWADDFEYTKWIGSEFLKLGENLLLACPSAVVNEEMNFLINPLHKDFKKLKIHNDVFKFDPRLFKNS